jgi:glucose-6-phosphate isomerase, archaeal
VASSWRLSQLEHLFCDRAAFGARLADGDEVVYRVEDVDGPGRDAQLGRAVTTIEPGDVGGEFFMTRGHMHAVRRDEVYVGLSGEGVVLMTDGERGAAQELSAGASVHIPAGWAHRTVNVGATRLRFLAVYHRDAGADYEWVRRRGMGAVVVADGETYRIDASRKTAA